MSKKILFTANLDSFFTKFLIPQLEYFKNNGYEVHVASKSENIDIPFCDKKFDVNFARSLNYKQNAESYKQMVELLKKDTRISSVYVLGHSMGGMLAPRIETQVDGVSGLIIMAGSPRTLHEIMIGQVEDIVSKQNSLVKWIMNISTKKMFDTFNKLDSMTIEEAKKTKLGNGTTAYYFKEIMEQKNLNS